MKKLILTLIGALCLSTTVLADHTFEDGTLHFDAHYVIPAVQGDLKPESVRRFDASYWIFLDNAGREVAYFTLPLELTGRKVQVTMQVTSVTKIDGVVHKTLEGRLGTAECVGPWKTTQCSYKFNDLQIDENDVRKFLNIKYGEDSSEFSEILSMSKVFSCDPIGELQTEIKPSSLKPIANCAQ